jgi:hypothetical protein
LRRWLWFVCHFGKRKRLSLLIGWRGGSHNSIGGSIGKILWLISGQSKISGLDWIIK